jgi:uncharacterized protein YigE (DUF2233 family)
MPLIRTARLAAVAFLFGCVSANAPASAACREETFEGSRYTVCSFDVTKSDLRMFWRDGKGEPYRSFHAVATALEADGEKLTFAMNGGMYNESFAPIGLYIEGGKELAPANTNTVSGPPAEIPNFYKKPNGVFYLGDDEAGVLETERFLNVRPETTFATQSGPLLLIDGAVHSAFIPDSDDLKPRNGVGVSGPTEVHFVISEDWVNFHALARFFRDRLGCKNALFLDGGTAPGLYAPELGRNDAPGHGGYGPMIGVVAK